ncbi:MAG: hypothetical protein WBV94_16425 [Blastocatellia bacterium]
MIKVLQIWHLISLALLIILYNIFRNNSEPYDYWRKDVDIAFAIGLSVWVALLTCYIIVDGIKEHAVGKIFQLYRRQLTKSSFLFISDVVVSAVVVGLLWQLLLYRQVEFLANKDVYLYLNDKPGQTERIGLIKKDQPIKFRLGVGRRYLVFKTPAENELLASEPLSVIPIWSSAAPIIIRKEFEQRTYEEILK